MYHSSIIPQQTKRQKQTSCLEAETKQINSVCYCFCCFFTDCCYYDGVIHLQATDTAVSQKRFPAAFSATTIRLGETSLKCTYGLKGLWNQISCLYSYSSCSCFIAVLHSLLNNLLSASCRPAASDPRTNEKSVYMKPQRLMAPLLRIALRSGKVPGAVNATLILYLL